MGNWPVLRQMNMEHKQALGLLPASAVQTVVASGTYQLAPMETLGPSVELLRLPKPGGGSYFVEYRWPSGVFDAQAPAVTGVLVHTQSPDLVDPNPNYNGDSDTALIDMHPGPDSIQPVDERGHDRRPGLRRPASRHLDPEHGPELRAAPRWPSPCRPTPRLPVVRAG